MAVVSRGHRGSAAFVQAVRMSQAKAQSPFSLATVDDAFGLVLDSGARIPTGLYMTSVPVNPNDTVFVSWLSPNRPVVTDNFTTRTTGGNTDPLTGGAKAIDTASYCSPLWFSQAYKDGVRLFIMQSWTHIDGDNPACEQNLVYAHEAGMAIAIYYTGSGNATNAITNAGVAAQWLKFVAVDVEDSQIVSQVNDIDVIEGAGYEARIYTSRGEWASCMGGSTAFSSLKLWDAAWDDTLTAEQWPDKVEIPGHEFVSYGGWTERWGWQWRSPSLNGVNQYFHEVLVDYDTFGDPGEPDSTDTGIAPGEVLPHTLEVDHSAIGTHVHSHGSLTGVTANQHHNQAHDINGADHTGTPLAIAKGGTNNTSGGATNGVGYFDGTKWTSEAAFTYDPATNTLLADTINPGSGGTSAGWSVGTDFVVGGNAYFNGTLVDFSAATALTVNFKDTGLAVGITDFADTTTYFQITQITNNDGGARLWGFSDSVGQTPMQLAGSFGSTDPTDTVPAVKITGSKRSGTGVTALGNAETVFQITNNTTTLMTFVGNGDSVQAGVPSIVGGSGLTSGHVFKATSSSAASFGQLAHTSLGSVGADDHHAQSHGASDHTDRTRNLWIPAQAFISRQGSPALAIVGASTAYQAWAFDQTTVEGILSEFVMPSDYTSGTLTVKLYWTNLGAGSGDVIWRIFIRNTAATGNLDSGGFTSGSDTITAPAQNVLKISTSSVSFTPVAGNVIQIIPDRNASNGSDNLGNDAGLVGVLIEYTADM